MNYDKDNTHRHNHRQDDEDSLDLFTAAISFLGINLMWIFFAGWVLFGMVPVLLLALFLNHLIDRLEIRIKEDQARNN
ncbi:histidinol phosphate aminotransferase [Pseudophaeobacter sp.]|uniref:histidinol phosphate aminotransferase n=1 Tax=Pseudophaeobacter sp. TaxID=1971739 RepID=UPI004058A0D6